MSHMPKVQFPPIIQIDKCYRPIEFVAFLGDSAKTRVFVVAKDEIIYAK
jgi:hypothetical protein